jgi:MFS family permease
MNANLRHTSRSELSAARGRHSLTGPLRIPVFRRIWLASLVSNLGSMIVGVGAAWSMMDMTRSAAWVGLVQSALQLPIAVMAAPAGAAADLFDRRRVALFALALSLAGSVVLAILAALSSVSPQTLLLFCFIIGCGNALYGPSWQAGVAEQVPGRTLAAAIALNGISFNIARSLGPAIGGVIVAAAGAVAAYATSALSYVPLVLALFAWRRVAEPSRLPPERLAGAVVAGVRYAANSPSVQAVLARTCLTGIAGSAASALMPLIARDLLHTGVTSYGVLLGCFGTGAVAGALLVGDIRSRLGSETTVRVCLAAVAVGVAATALSRWSLLSGAGLVVAGAGWTASLTVYNITIQLAVPRWVAGRAVCVLPRAGASGGLALGSWLWGEAAARVGVEAVLIGSCAALLLVVAVGFWKPLPHTTAPNAQSEAPLTEIDLRLPLTGRSGPIVLEFEYRVDPNQARDFYDVIQQVQLSRLRNGGYDWSISRDIEAPELWIERFHRPTWLAI